MTNMQERKKLLEDIFQLKDPQKLPQLTKSLRDIGWDSPEGEVANLRSMHILLILQRYLNGELDEQQVEDWANLVEIREDITFGVHEDEKAVMEAIHDLANPVLEGALTHERAKKLILGLQESA